MYPCILPPLTTPFVQMADMDRHVMVVTTQLRTMITIPKPVTHVHDSLEILDFHLGNEGIVCK